MRRFILLLALAVLLCSCGGRSVSSAPADASPSSTAESVSASASVADEVSSQETVVLPELSGIFVAVPGELVDNFSQGRQLALGTDADKTHFDEVLATLRENTSVIKLTYNQGDTTENFDLTAEQCETLLANVAGYSYSVFDSAPGNPSTGGSWQIGFYAADGSEILYVNCDEMWFTLCDDDVRSCIFKAEGGECNPYLVVATDKIARDAADSQ